MYDTQRDDLGAPEGPDGPGGPDPVLLDLLVAWDEGTTAGAGLTPEEVCRDHPDRLPDLLRLLPLVGRVDALLGRDGGAARPDLPGFDLLEEVGRGGMGAVYKARQPGLNRVVAVKVPHPEAAAGLSRDRFAREAEAVAGLDHPHIVPVYDADLTGGRPYFVMKYLPGGSLADRRAAGPVPPAEAVGLVEPVARAVHHAHGRGVVHRDLKPSNVLLDADGRPAVGDFGVAALLAGRDDPAAAGPAGGDRPGGRLTLAGRLVGTPAYVAPELHPWRGGTASAKSDVWSLGVILYELLTGEPPFGRDPVNDRPRTWAVRWPRAARVDARLRAVVGKCLAEAPADRYASAEALAGALAGWQRRRRLREVARRAGMVALAVLAVGAVAAYSLWPDPPEVVRAVKYHHLRGQLAAGEPVEVVPASGEPPAYRVRLAEPGVGRAFADPDGTFVVDSGPDRIALVEFLDYPEVERYRFSVEIRTDEGYGNAYAGLYHSHEVQAGRHELVHLYGNLGVRVGDGRDPPARDDTDGFRPKFGILGMAEPGEEGGPWTKFQSILRPTAGPEAPAAPWRRLSVDVTPGGVRGRIEGGRGGAVAAGYTRDEFRRFVADLPDLLQAAFGAEFNARPDGGVGVYVFRCRASFRNGRIEPLPEGR